MSNTYRELINKHTIFDLVIKVQNYCAYETLNRNLNYNSKKRNFEYLKYHL